MRQWIRDRVHRARWRRDQAQLEKAYQQFDAMTAPEQLRWLWRFMEHALPSGSAERIAIGYQLRALAQIVGRGWRRQRPLGPLSHRALKTVHAAVSSGYQAFTASAQADLTARVGWWLPPHRIRYRRLQAPTDNPRAWTPLIEFYEAATEPAGIVTALGHFLRRHQSGFRSCECGCGEQFGVAGKRKYLNRQHQNRATQKKLYKKRKLERRGYEASNFA
jgi:hypothetical protein